uniref:Uncharacterized protein n=1 Tax=Percolomonas cosmopolitus TaxID=63605 RepID=A0A7S1KM83_9EUKA
MSLFRKSSQSTLRLASNKLSNSVVTSQKRLASGGGGAARPIRPFWKYSTKGELQINRGTTLIRDIIAILALYSGYQIFVKTPEHVEPIVNEVY